MCVGKLNDIGVGSYFGEGKWKLTKGFLILARGVKQECLYVTKIKLCKQEVNVAETSSNIDLWHKRLGNMSKKGMHSLAHKDLLLEVKAMTLRPCVDCLAGKQHIGLPFVHPLFHMVQEIFLILCILMFVP